MVQRDRLAAVAALAIPVLAGAVWMAAFGAPAHYALTNLAALAVMSLWVMFGQGPHTALSRYMLFWALLAVMLSAMLIGPELTSATDHRVARWLPLGPLALHSGMIAAPAIAVLAARNRRYGAVFLVLAGLAAYLQPDAATGFALTFAAVGIYHVKRNWKMGLATIVLFVASIVMALRGEIAPQPFVERALVEAAGQNIAVALLLAAALLASFLLMLFAVPLSREKRFALGGALFGFVTMSMISNYPTPLIGYGAAPIIGFGLALGLQRIPQR